MKAKLTVLATLVAVLVATFVMAAPAASGAPECAPQVYIEAYRVQIRSLEESYAIGETVRATLKVTRRDTGEPVAGAHAWFAMTIDDGGREDDDAYHFAIDRTNRSGKARFAFRLAPRWARPGVADVFAYVWKDIVTVKQACVDVNEYGSRSKRNAFRITP